MVQRGGFGSSLYSTSAFLPPFRRHLCQSLEEWRLTYKCATAPLSIQFPYVVTWLHAETLLGHLSQSLGVGRLWPRTRLGLGFGGEQRQEDGHGTWSREETLTYVGAEVGRAELDSTLVCRNGAGEAEFCFSCFYMTLVLTLDWNDLETLVTMGYKISYIY